MVDVAKIAGVSQPTVSRILNGNQVLNSFSEATIRKVHDAIARLDYHPNLAARSLRTRKTFLIAVLVADLGNLRSAQIVDAILNEVQARNYDVILGCSHGKADYEHRFCETMSGRSVEGIILIPNQLPISYIDHLRQSIAVPIIFYAQQVTHSNSHILSTCNEGTIRESIPAEEAQEIATKLTHLLFQCLERNEYE